MKYSLLIFIKLICSICLFNIILLSYISVFIQNIDIDFLIFINFLILNICIFFIFQW
jgi:hypothetical protein